MSGPMPRKDDMRWSATYRVISRQTTPALRLAHHRVRVHLPYHVLRRATRVTRPASLRHAVLRKAPITRRRVWVWWRRRRGLLQRFAHDDERRKRTRGGHPHLGEDGGRSVVRGQKRANQHPS